MTRPGGLEYWEIRLRAAIRVDQCERRRRRRPETYHAGQGLSEYVDCGLWTTEPLSP